MIDSFDIAGFRQTLGRFATGVTVVTALSEGRPHGMTANSFTAVSLSPPLVLVAVDNRARMREILGRSRRYGISILHADQRDVSGHFAGRPIDGLDVEFDWLDGLPVIAGALAHLVCSIHDTVPAGDHTLQIGRVDHFRRPERIESRAPLIFFASRYATVHAHGAEAKG
jgi:flavin reductase (DIM6/NTAB) family NADH-FMN oxidoreductase RutF